MQHHAARIGLVAVALDEPAVSGILRQPLRLGDIAVDAAEPLLAFDDLLRTVEPALGQQRRQHAVRGGLPGVERLAHGAAVLLHATGLRCGDAQAKGEPLRIEAEELAGGGAGRDGAERAGQMPAALVMAGRGAPAAHAGLEARRIGTGERAAVDGVALCQRKQRRKDR